MRIDGMQGREFPPVEFIVGDRLSVMNYARALDIEDQTLLCMGAAREAGYRGRPLPPVMLLFFLAISGDVLQQELGFTWGKTLAAGVEFEFGRVVTEEDVVIGRGLVEEAYERPGKDGVMRQFMRLCTEFQDAEGELVCRSRMLFIERDSQVAMT